MLLSGKSDQGTLVNIRHLVIEGSSQWVIGPNVTKMCDILHIGKNVLQLPAYENSAQATITLVDHDMHSYVPVQVLKKSRNPLQDSDKTILFCATATVNGSGKELPWSDTKTHR